MKIIWKSAPIGTNDVVSKLRGRNGWSDRTIQTMLSRLVKKGVLQYTKRSREYVYTPLVEEKNYSAEESNSFLDKFYNGALNSMVLNFLEEDRLSDEDIEELTQILERRKKGGDS